MNSVDLIVKSHEELKNRGLKAQNPDQSVAMCKCFADSIEACHWKGFCEEDVHILFERALGNSKYHKKDATNDEGGSGNIEQQA